MSGIWSPPKLGCATPRKSPSMYFEIVAQYKRLHDKTVIECTEADAQSALGLCIQSSHLHTSSAGAETIDVDDGRMNILYRPLQCSKLITSERVWMSCEMRYTSHVSGVIFIFVPEYRHSPQSTSSLDLSRTYCICVRDKLDIREWLALTILSQPHAKEFSRSLPVLRVDELHSTLSTILEVLIGDQVEVICCFFERRLLHRASNQDCWNSPNGGRSVFIEKAEYFVRRRLAIQFCLPAFPCKSTNTDKVASTIPDGGEYEALTTLHNFCIDAKKLYEPGCRIEIISDGHVFADCIGVDDHVVSKYNRSLQEMSEIIYQEIQLTLPLTEKCENQVSFVGLHNILFPTKASEMLFSSAHVSTTIYHPMKTLISSRDDMNRRLLLQSCKPSSDFARHMIRTNPNHALTQLYRGFSRFMLDDLAFHPDSQNMSKTERRRVAGRVGLEMMQRNQSYSNLIKLTMPQHIRLSIHAHDNSGAKIAISLLPPSQFQALHSFDRMTFRRNYSDDLETRQHLHIPTPWHNVLVEIEDHQKIYICKSAIVEKELARPDSPWCPESVYMSDHSRGGRYVLKLKRPESQTSSSSSVDSDSPALTPLGMIYDEVEVLSGIQALPAKSVGEEVSLVEHIATKVAICVKISEQRIENDTSQSQPLICE